MNEKGAPDPRWAYGVDKTAWELIERARSLMSREGFDLGEVRFDQNRHYIYEVRCANRALYLFFEWYRDGTVWYAPFPYDTGTRCMKRLLTYDRGTGVNFKPPPEGPSFKPVPPQDSAETALVAGLHEIFAV